MAGAPESRGSWVSGGTRSHWVRFKRGANPKDLLASFWVRMGSFHKLTHDSKSFSWFVRSFSAIFSPPPLRRSPPRPLGDGFLRGKSRRPKSAVCATFSVSSHLLFRNLLVHRTNLHQGAGASLFLSVPELTVTGRAITPKCSIPYYIMSRTIFVYFVSKAYNRDKKYKRYKKTNVTKNTNYKEQASSLARALEWAMSQCLITRAHASLVTGLRDGLVVTRHGPLPATNGVGLTVAYKNLLLCIYIYYGDESPRKAICTSTL